METSTIDKLFLELAQFTSARTDRECGLIRLCDSVKDDLLKLSYAIERLPASEQQTALSVQANDLRNKITTGLAAHS